MRAYLECLGTPPVIGAAAGVVTLISEDGMTGVIELGCDEVQRVDYYVGTMLPGPGSPSSFSWDVTLTVVKASLAEKITITCPASGIGSGIAICELPGTNNAVVFEIAGPGRLFVPIMER